ncbi:hypothetical protein RKD52_000947 [Metabacillus sp. SLBN-84]
MGKLLNKLDMTKQDLLFGISGSLLIASILQFIAY